MTDKETKKTDVEIEKALECCTKDPCGDCTNCPYDKNINSICLTQLAKDALDYINYLKSTIADLFKDIDCLRKLDKEIRKETANCANRDHKRLWTKRIPTMPKNLPKGQRQRRKF